MPEKIRVTIDGQALDQNYFYPIVDTDLPQRSSGECGSLRSGQIVTLVDNVEEGHDYDGLIIGRAADGIWRAISLHPGWLIGRDRYLQRTVWDDADILRFPDIE